MSATRAERTLAGIVKASSGGQVLPCFFAHARGRRVRQGQLTSSVMAKICIIMCCRHIVIVEKQKDVF
jgi:hypothetical protein